MSTTKYKKIIEKIKGYACQECNISEWNSKNICLELDHIDGNNKNNNTNNLRLLCPNCHSQTINFRGRNINTGKIKVSDEELTQALHETNNIRQALLKVNLTPKGGNYKRAAVLLNMYYEKTIDIKNSQYNTKWINNSHVNKKIKSTQLDEYIQAGWNLGRISLQKPPSAKGKKWITNGITNRFISVNEISEGWWLGKIQK
jgi:hypothetical protein